MRVARTGFALLAIALPAAAQSLLGEGGGSPYDPAKRPPFRKHDLIQIVAVERSKASSDADLRTDRRSRWEMDPKKFIKLSDGDVFPDLDAAALTGNPKIDLDARYRRDNSGRTSRNFDLTFTVTAEIVDIRPNGNLVIEAKKRRKVNNDEEYIRLTGEVAPTAVVNNVVKSESIANLDITYEGNGPANDSSQPGFFGWLFDKLWPF